MYLMPFSYKIKKNCIFWIQGFHLLKLCLTNMKLFSYSFNITLGKFETCFMDPKPPKLDAIYMYFVQIFIRLKYTDQQLFVKTYTYSISYTQSPLFPNFLVVFSNSFFNYFYLPFLFVWWSLPRKNTATITANKIMITITNIITIHLKMKNIKLIIFIDVNIFIIKMKLMNTTFFRYC